MIISVICSYIGAALMVKKDRSRERLFVSRAQPTYHSTFGLTWLGIALLSSSSGWLVHKDTKSLDATSISYSSLLARAMLRLDSDV